MLVGWLADPVDSGVVSNSGVVRVNHDDFVPFVNRILAYPVRVEHS
jgi:hypothetical protein